MNAEDERMDLDMGPVADDLFELFELEVEVDVVVVETDANELRPRPCPPAPPDTDIALDAELDARDNADVDFARPNFNFIEGARLACLCAGDIDIDIDIETDMDADGDVDALAAEDRKLAWLLLLDSASFERRLVNAEGASSSSLKRNTYALASVVYLYTNEKVKK